MGDYRLSKTEKRILAAIRKYPYVDIGFPELNGYLKFPAAEEILTALSDLERLGFIAEKTFPKNCYSLTSEGTRYLVSHRWLTSKLWPAVKTCLGYAICAFITWAITTMLS